MELTEPSPISSGLEWSQSLLEAIGQVQRQLQSGSRHSESNARILTAALKLMCGRNGMLANISGNEPCRLTDVVSDSVNRVELLSRFDELARCALERGDNVIDRSPGESVAVAVLLRIGAEVYGVLVVDDARLTLDDALIESMEAFSVTVAAVLRQFQEDLSASQVGAVLDSLAEGVVTINERGCVVAMNAAAEQIFGYNAEEVIAKNASMLMPDPLVAGPDGFLHRFIENGEPPIRGFSREVEGQRKDGSVFPMDLSVSLIEVQGSSLFIGITRDITEHKMRQEMVEIERANTQTLELLVRIDALTGIANRRHFDETLEVEVRRAAREQKPVAMILGDIDFFKSFNDRYGHLAGDKALRAVAQAVDSCFQRAGELAARYGGEEFGVVVGGADQTAAAKLAEKMRQRVAALSIPHGTSPIADYLTISIGVASVVPDPRFDPMQLIDEADRALYRAKGSGRDRIVLAGSGPDNRKLHAL